MKGFVWMDVRLDRNNTCRYVNVMKFSVRQSNVSALQVVYLIYICLFYGKGKSSPVDIVESSAQVKNDLMELGLSADMSNSIEEVIKAFVSSMNDKW